MVSRFFTYNFNSNIIIIDKAGCLNYAAYLIVIEHFNIKRFMLLDDHETALYCRFWATYPIGVSWQSPYVSLDLV